MNAELIKEIIWDQTRALLSNTNAVLAQLCQAQGVFVLQSRIIAVVHEHETLTIGQISDLINVAKANVSTMCRKLENEGYLERKRDTYDERVVNVTLSKKGKDVAAYFDHEIQNLVKRADDSLTDDDLMAMSRGLKKLNELLISMTQLP